MVVATQSGATEIPAELVEYYAFQETFVPPAGIDAIDGNHYAADDIPATSAGREARANAILPIIFEALARAIYGGRHGPMGEIGNVTNGQLHKAHISWVCWKNLSSFIGVPTESATNMAILLSEHFGATWIVAIAIG